MKPSELKAAWLKANHWSAATGITANLISMRLRLGWTVERALTEPVKRMAVK